MTPQAYARLRPGTILGSEDKRICLIKKRLHTASGTLALQKSNRHDADTFPCPLRM